ncbi:MAG: hypothetical protein ACI927_000752 [Oceanospirillaceae bacterium]|jgi:hypothetical protein
MIKSLGKYSVGGNAVDGFMPPPVSTDLDVVATDGGITIRATKVL